MADSVQIKGGAKASMPVLAERELGWCSDTGELYVGNGRENRKVGADIERKLELACDDIEADLGKKLTATPTAAQNALAEDAELAAVISAYNALVAAMKASGVMSE